MPVDIRPIIEQLRATGDGALSLPEKLQLIETACAQSPELGMQIYAWALEEIPRLARGLVSAKGTIAKLKETVETLTALPWFPATFLHLLATQEGDRAEVACGSLHRLVGLAGDVDPTGLAKGDEVFLSRDQNIILAKSPLGVPPVGETARFERWMADGRIVLKARDEPFVVEAIGDLRSANLKPGDLIRWHKDSWMAYEKVEDAAGREYLLTDIPRIGRHCVGGQDENLARLLDALTRFLLNPTKANLYGVGDARQTILMVGSPGCGKTLMARVGVSEVARISGQRCRFAVVKPGAWETPWVGETQQNIRRCFVALKEAAEDGFAILFLDEIESIGRTRGSSVGQHSDKFLAALLAELDGFANRKNIVIMAATNRKDLIDPALLERISEVEILVKRPDRRAARAIFEIHLPAGLPYHAGGSSPEAMREAMLDTAVARFFSPNAESELCVLRFRDRSTRTVLARELASGRLIGQVCHAAKQAAFLRDVRGGEAGLTVADIDRAAAEAVTRLASTLTLRNAHDYLADLPQDVDLVSVDQIVRKVREPRRYLNLEVA